MAERNNPILEQTKDEMEIIPYTKRDRVAVYLIFCVVVANFLLLVFTLPWGEWF